MAARNWVLPGRWRPGLRRRRRGRAARTTWRCAGGAPRGACPRQSVWRLIGQGPAVKVGTAFNWLLRRHPGLGRRRPLGCRSQGAGSSCGCAVGAGGCGGGLGRRAGCREGIPTRGRPSHSVRWLVRCLSVAVWALPRARAGATAGACPRRGCRRGIVLWRGGGHHACCLEAFGWPALGVPVVRLLNIFFTELF